MQEFIQMAAAKLGTSDGAARSAVGGLLKLVREEASPQDAQQLMSSLPGASQLLGARDASTPGDGGAILGGALKKAAGAASGKLGATLGLAGTLAGSGLNKSQIGPFVSLFVDYAKQKAGKDVVARILGRVPQLQQLLG